MNLNFLGIRKGMSDKIAKKQIEERENTNNGNLFNGKPIDPEKMAGYLKTLPGAPERIFALTEAQLRHRHWIEKLTACSNFIRSFLGLVFAAVLTLCFLAGGVLCIMYNHELAGGAIIGGSTLTRLITNFIYGTKKSVVQNGKV
jgi:uncharacterized membrane protein